MFLYRITLILYERRRCRAKKETSMIKTVLNSQAKKTTGCAVTYRAGSKSTHGTCPNTCKLMSGCKVGTNKIDAAYVRALSHAIPVKGIAFTYTHFAPSLWRKHATGKTVINYSADSLRVARNQQARVFPRSRLCHVPRGMIAPPIFVASRSIDAPPSTNWA